MIYRPEKINGINVPYNMLIEDIKKMLNDDMQKFSVACEALAAYETQESLDILTSFFKNDDAFKRRVAIDAIARHIFWEQVSDEVMEYLNDESPYVVRTVLDIITQKKIYKVHDRLIKMLKTCDINMLESIFSTLSNIPLESDFSLGIQYYEHKNENVQKIAVTLILKTADKNNWNIAFHALKKSNRPKDRLAACKLLNCFGDVEKSENIKEFLFDVDGHVRKYAQSAINNN